MLIAIHFVHLTSFTLQSLSSNNLKKVEIGSAVKMKSVALQHVPTACIGGQEIRLETSSGCGNLAESWNQQPIPKMKGTMLRMASRMYWGRGKLAWKPAVDVETRRILEVRNRSPK